ncbi:MAG: hypothetical protein AAF701_07845, partial [Pseudomonadota bacterium]
SVLEALRIKRIRLKSLVAEGYGEAQPVADNGTEEGREENRRIEFRLISPTAVNLDPDAVPTEGQADE